MAPKSRPGTPAQPPPEEPPVEEGEPEPEVFQPGMTPTRVEEFRGVEHDPEQAAKYLSEMMELPEYTHEARSAIKLDYYSSVLDCCKAAKLSPVQAAELHSISDTLLACSISGRPQAEAQEALCTAMLERCCAAPKPEEPKFSPEHVARISQFFANAYFR